MFASIMPRKHPLGHTSRARKCKNAFKIAWPIKSASFFGIFLIIVSSCIDHLKEVGRRKLLMVTDNHHLFGPCDNSERILRCDLTGLVDNKKIEAKFTRRKKLSYRHWTHKKNR